MMATTSGGLVMMIYDPTPMRSAKPAIGCQVKSNWIGSGWTGLDWSGLVWSDRVSS
jgi:hypothetical protein